MNHYHDGDEHIGVRYIVCEGSLDAGWKFTGPFPTFDDASDWAGAHCDHGGGWIATLYPTPEERQADILRRQNTVDTVGQSD
jgi:hypothetical protein